MIKKFSVFQKLLLSICVPPLVLVLPALAFSHGSANGASGLIIIALLLVSVICSLLLSYLLLLKNIRAMSRFLKNSQQKEGDLTRRMPVFGGDEISAIAKDHNIFISQIHKIVFKLKNIVKRSDTISQSLATSAEGVASSIEQITASSKAMLEREKVLNNFIHTSREDVSEISEAIENIVEQIDTQAASVNQSSAAIEQAIASIQNMNNLSRSKAGLVQKLDTMAAEGEKDMRHTLTAMNEVTSSVDLIQKLIKVINGVAAKTNMLAMNAAIEAAHAGEQGKGFSVVANEIRKLAEETARNAKEINTNLSTMVNGIEESQTLTEKTDESIKELIFGIKDVSNSFSEIIAGLNEMSTGTSEITGSLARLIEITENVKNNSHVIGEKSNHIDAAMNKVIGISEETMNSVDEFSKGVEEIRKASEFISRAGIENAENIAIVDREVAKFTIIDTSGLKSSDGQALIQWNKKEKEIPERPASPENLPETDSGRWYDLEYAGWHIKKTNIPQSAADGALGKKVILLESCDHPYHTAYKNGCRKIAEAFGVRLSSFNANYSHELQAKQVVQAINEKPDLIILTPTDINASTDWFRTINSAGIPVIGSNTTPTAEGFKYILGWTGPDDWGQFRLMAHTFADLMKNKGQYGIIQHAKGNSNYYSRCYSIITELKQIAPDMNCIVAESAIREDDTRKLVAKWLREYGHQLNGLCFSDPAYGAKGMCDAVNEAKRQDMILVSSGNSKVTQDLLRSGHLNAITFQSAEADGALAMEMAIDWFNGIKIQPIRYLPMKIITKENVEDFYPSQW